MQNFVHQKLGRYRIVSEIAKGGMAQIYRAQLLGIAGFAKDVAIKKILPFWSANEEFIGMLIDEAKILVQLQHPNIVQVFELGKEHDAFFIVMEYVQGLDLRSLTKILQEQNHKLPQPLIAYIIKQICLGLDFAHHKTDTNAAPLHIVHRDISPQNILIGCEGEIKITDFGIAKTTQKTTHTQTGVLKGKFSYMSPEQALGEDIDQQTDIFALGLLLFELLHGHKCFDGKNDFEIIDKVKNAAIAIDENLDTDLKAILHTSLATHKVNRYTTALEMYHDLEAWEKSLSQKCLARDLKVFLKEHVPSIWQNATPIAPLQNSESQTAAHISSTPSPSYTIITEATTLWEKTQIDNTAKTRLHTILEKTKILLRPQNKSRTTLWRSGIAVSILAMLFLWWTKNPTPQPATPPVLITEVTVVNSTPTPSAVVAESAAPIQNPEPQTLALANTTPTVDAISPVATKTVEYGKLVVDSRPWAQFTVEGFSNKRFSTPSTVQLPVGNYTLKVFSPSQKKSSSKNIVIKPNTSAFCRATFASKNSVACSYNP